MKANKPELIVLGGPTAVGKTSLAISWAQQWKTEIVSADSRQFYREMSIGTAKPSLEEMQGIPHHLIGHLSIHEDYDVAAFERDAMQVLEILFEKHEKVILVGGSGLYIKALMHGIDDIPETPQEIRDALQIDFEQNGIAILQEELQKVDPLSYSQIDVKNPRRIIRALEVYRTSGTPISVWRLRKPKERFFNVKACYLDMPREQLYARIDQRVLDMMEAGLLDEVKSLKDFSHLNALHTVGYTELFAHLKGECSFEEAIAQIQQNTRRYAKRQMTWFRNQLGFEKIV